MVWRMTTGLSRSTLHRPDKDVVLNLKQQVNKTPKRHLTAFQTNSSHVADHRMSSEVEFQSLFFLHFVKQVAASQFLPPVRTVPPTRPTTPGREPTPTLAAGIWNIWSLFGRVRAVLSGETWLRSRLVSRWMSCDPGGEL